MNEIKRCERCGVVISVLEHTDYYSHLSIKYCRSCAQSGEREKTAARMRELRKRKRAQNKQRDIKLSLLEEENELQREENELLRRSIIALREQIERVKNA